MNACVHTDTKPQTSSTRSRGLGWRIHGSVEDTKLSTNKQHTLSPDYLVAPDSQDMIGFLKTHAEADALSSKITLPDNWLSTPHDDLDACKYVCLERSKNLEYWTFRPSAFRKHSANDISEEIQKYMYTLPDIFKKTMIKKLPGVPLNSKTTAILIRVAEI